MIIARKNKIPEFCMILPENTRILHNNCPKNICSRFFLGGGGHVPPSPVSYAYGFMYDPSATAMTKRMDRSMSSYLGRVIAVAEFGFALNQSIPMSCLSTIIKLLPAQYVE